MELRQLTCFVAVAEERSFTRAADRLHLVQSAVSAIIKSLEREAGARLLDRTSKHVALTDAGAALLPRARATLDAARSAQDAVDAVRGGLRGTLRIGTMTSVGQVDVPALLGAFHRAHPGVTLRLLLAPTGSQGLVEALAAGTLDLALASLPGTIPPGITLRPLWSAPLDLVVPRSHRLANRHRVSIAELAGDAFVDFPLGYGNRTVVDRAFALARVHRQVTMEVASFPTGAAVVRHGLGIAILPRFAVAESSDLVSIPLEGGQPGETILWPVAVATSSTRELGAAARALLALVEDQVPTPAGGEPGAAPDQSRSLRSASNSWTSQRCGAR
ncbi:MAG: LysR family transcriptional regulator [Candidatus Dormiibacterota bacterium]